MAQVELKREAQAVGPDARTLAVSWTGGKDCNLALLAAWRDPYFHVTALIVFRPKVGRCRCRSAIVCAGLVPGRGGERLCWV